jgi:hypothetical protein
VRLFLDLHLSGRAIGGPLRADGHVVLAGADDPACSGMPDDDLLRIASQQGRIFLSCDRGIVQLVRRWAFEGLEHAGVLLLLGIRQNEYGAPLRAIRASLAQQPEHARWHDVLMLVGRSGP